MKKTVRFLSLLMALALVGMLAGCNTTENKSNPNTDPDPSDWAGEPTARTSLTVGFDASFPPYGYIDDSGDYVGFDIDLAREVCERQGWELVLRPIDWNSKDLELSSGAIDCIWNGFTINGREDQYTWSVPYVDNSQVVVVMADSGIASLGDLAGKTVIVQDDSSAHHALEGFDPVEDAELYELVERFAAITLVPEYNTAFMNLEAGAGDAVILDIGVANYQLEVRDGFLMLDDILVKEQYGVGFDLGNTALRDAVEETLLAMYADGTVERIAGDWGLADSVILG